MWFTGVQEVQRGKRDGPPSPKGGIEKGEVRSWKTVVNMQVLRVHKTNATNLFNEIYIVTVTVGFLNIRAIKEKYRRKYSEGWKYVEEKGITLLAKNDNKMLNCTDHREYIRVESLFAHPLLAVKLTHPFS